jgi:hypothetical protein
MELRRAVTTSDKLDHAISRQGSLSEDAELPRAAEYDGVSSTVKLRSTQMLAVC